MQFETDFKELRLLRAQEGKHRHIRLLQWIVVIVGLAALPFIITTYLPMFMYKANDVAAMRVIGICFPTVVVLLTILIVNLCIGRHLSHYVGYKGYEMLELTDKGIEDEYTPIWERLPLAKLRSDVSFSQIRRIENNTYHNAIKVYAPFTISSYVSSQRGKHEKVRRFDAPESFRVYYKYYVNSEALLEEISRRSGVRIDRVDTPDRQLMERR